MDKELTEAITHESVRTVQNFFNQHIDDSQIVFPSVLGYSGVWMAICADEVLGIVFLGEEGQQRVNVCRREGVHPFPGFMIGESKRPPERRASYNVTSPFRFYTGKHTQDTFAFSLGKEGSCVVMDHVHGLSDSQGRLVSYGIDLAFLLGYSEQEPGNGLQERLSALLEHCLDVWRSEPA